MANVALNKYSDASNSMYPYRPALAVDGVSTPLNRWVGSSPLPVSGTPAPVWLRVDLGTTFWINRWVVKQMGVVGWSPNFNLTDYKLQGSLDNANWFDIDSVTNNSANQTDRPFTPRKARWVRAYVTKGLRCNTNFASIVDMEVYDAPNAPSLTGLTISNGALIPGFSSTTYSYSDTVGNDVHQITVTPTAASGTIKVNNEVVTSGTPSKLIDLAVGSNTVTVTVTSSDNLMTETYTINVTRSGLAAYLSDLVLKTSMGALITLAPTPFDKNVFDYTASVASGISSVKVTPTAEVSSSTITVNGQLVTSGQQSGPINLGMGLTTITIIVTATGGGQGTYTIGVTRT